MAISYTVLKVMKLLSDWEKRLYALSNFTSVILLLVAESLTFWLHLYKERTLEVMMINAMLFGLFAAQIIVFNMAKVLG